MSASPDLSSKSISPLPAKSPLFAMNGSGMKSPIEFQDERLKWTEDNVCDDTKSGDPKPMSKDVRLARLQAAFTTILECIGEDPTRDGLLETPTRAAKAMMFLTKGYEENVSMVVKQAVFKEDFSEIVLVKDIEFYSLCEHHLIPFYGKIHIGYIPSNNVLGLSKLARIAEMFTRRLQVQERLTQQIADAVINAIVPTGVGVIIEAVHMCMCMRGVQKQCAKTITSKMLGTFLDDPRTRDEFLRMCHS